MGQKILKKIKIQQIDKVFDVTLTLVFCPAFYHKFLYSTLPPLPHLSLVHLFLPAIHEQCEHTHFTSSFMFFETSSRFNSKCTCRCVHTGGSTCGYTPPPFTAIFETSLYSHPLPIFATSHLPPPPYFCNLLDDGKNDFTPPPSTSDVCQKYCYYYRELR